MISGTIHENRNLRVLKLYAGKHTEGQPNPFFATIIPMRSAPTKFPPAVLLCYPLTSFGACVGADV
jgi:hypothetical protein